MSLDMDRLWKQILLGNTHGMHNTQESHRLMKHQWMMLFGSDESTKPAAIVDAVAELCESRDSFTRQLMDILQVDSADRWFNDCNDCHNNNDIHMDSIYISDIDYNTRQKIVSIPGL